MFQEYTAIINKTANTNTASFGMSVSHCAFPYEWVNSTRIKFTNRDCLRGFKDKVAEWLDERAVRDNFTWEWEA